MGDHRRAARARSADRSEFAVCQTGRAQGAARRQPQGLTPLYECSLERQRLDKWLWHARVVKARTSAAALVEAGHVRINGVREKSPGHGVKPGDVLTIGLDHGVRMLKVTGFAERRGDAASARVLYEDLQASGLQKP